MKLLSQLTPLRWTISLLVFIYLAMASNGSAQWVKGGFLRYQEFDNNSPRQIVVPSSEIWECVSGNYANSGPLHLGLFPPGKPIDLSWNQKLVVACYTLGPITPPAEVQQLRTDIATLQTRVNELTSQNAAAQNQIAELNRQLAVGRQEWISQYGTNVQLLLKFVATNVVDEAVRQKYEGKISQLEGRVKELEKKLSGGK